VVRFSGDSGDGMQLAGNIFSNISATVGNDISTFPDYPADIRAPQGSLTGVSGFQVHIGAGKVLLLVTNATYGRNECRCIENTIQICEVHSLYHY
jgi:OAFO_sf: 2-oxoacid:acceptor oxidoreductase, alpha subunit